RTDSRSPSRACLGALTLAMGTTMIIICKPACSCASTTLNTRRTRSTSHQFRAQFATSLIRRPNGLDDSSMLAYNTPERAGILCAGTQIEDVDYPGIRVK